MTKDSYSVSESENLRGEWVLRKLGDPPYQAGAESLPLQRDQQGWLYEWEGFQAQVPAGRPIRIQVGEVFRSSASYSCERWV